MNRSLLPVLLLGAVLAQWPYAPSPNTFNAYCQWPSNVAVGLRCKFNSNLSLLNLSVKTGDIVQANPTFSLPTASIYKIQSELRGNTFQFASTDKLTFTYANVAYNTTTYSLGVIDQTMTPSNPFANALSPFTLQGSLNKVLFYDGILRINLMANSFSSDNRCEIPLDTPVMTLVSSSWASGYALEPDCLTITVQSPCDKVAFYSALRFVSPLYGYASNVTQALKVHLFSQYVNTGDKFFKNGVMMSSSLYSFTATTQGGDFGWNFGTAENLQVSYKVCGLLPPPPGVGTFDVGYKLYDSEVFYTFLR